MFLRLSASRSQTFNAKSDTKTSFAPPQSSNWNPPVEADSAQNARDPEQLEWAKEGIEQLAECSQCRPAHLSDARVSSLQGLERLAGSQVSSQRPIALSEAPSESSKRESRLNWERLHLRIA